MTIISRILLLLLTLLVATPGHAQFSDQSTWAGTAGGSANAITLAIANWDINRAGVSLRFLPSADNTNATTINVNGVGAVAVNKPQNTGLGALTGGELRSGQLAVVVYDGTRFVLQNQLGQFTHASDYALSALSYTAPANLQIAASVGSNNLTIALKTAAGADPTAVTPIPLLFRDTTIANGDPVRQDVVTALSFTINSGNTMACVSGQMCRLWVLVFNNSGTPVLCAANMLDSTNSRIWPLNEGTVGSSGSGTNGGNNPGTAYCSVSAIASKAFRILGYVEVQEAAAGTWATAPTYVQLFGPGIKKPGDIVQTLYFTTTTAGANACGTTGSYNSTAVTLNLTPTSAANVVKYFANGTIVIGNVGNTNTFQMFRNSTGVGGIVPLVGNAVANTSGVIPLFGLDIPNTTSAVTYVVKCSDNGATGIATYPAGGGFEMLEEIMGANDNDWLRDVG